MAVTQQIAILSVDMLEQCKNDLTVLDKLVSFELLADECYTDLDWSLSYLCKLFELENNPDESSKAFNLLIEGEGIVNKEYDGCEFGEIPRFIGKNKIKSIASILESLTVNDAFKRLPDSLKEINKILGSEFDRDPRSYLNTNFDALRLAVSSASKSSKVIVTWWD